MTSAAQQPHDAADPYMLETPAAFVGDLDIPHVGEQSYHQVLEFAYSYLMPTAVHAQHSSNRWERMLPFPMHHAGGTAAREIQSNIGGTQEHCIITTT